MVSVCSLQEKNFPGSVGPAPQICFRSGAKVAIPYFNVDLISVEFQN